MINIANIQAVIMAHPFPANPFLLKWLDSIGIKWRLGSKDYGTDLARNQSINRQILIALNV